MRLPQCQAANLDLAKIEDYCLNPSHPRGRHKARVFREALGLARADAAWFRKSLLDGITKADAELIETDDFGARWRADIPVTRQGAAAVVRTVWIVRAGENFPRFVSCWVL